MGLNEEMIIKANGQAIYWDKKSRVRREFTLAIKEIQELQVLVSQLSEKRVGKEYPEAIIYKIKTKGKIITIIPSPDKESERILPLIRLINKWVSLARGGNSW